MRSVRCVLNISLQNIRKWSEDYRIWTIAVLVIILCFDSVRIMNHYRCGARKQFVAMDLSLCVQSISYEAAVFPADNSDVL